MTRWEALCYTVLDNQRSAGQEVKQVDKYEYRLSTQEMLSCVASGDYRKAEEIADSIDWRKVKSVSMLSTVSGIYEERRRYEDAREILFIAYDRAPNSRKIIFGLAELALKMGDIEEARDCYNEFRAVAPNDGNQYVLKYEIAKTAGEPLSTQIKALEEFKEVEYVERWAYELAKLYEKAGLTEKCIEECDDLVLWFNNGKYVRKALELKRRYRPLTGSQLAKYMDNGEFEHEVEPSEKQREAELLLDDEKKAIAAEGEAAAKAAAEAEQRAGAPSQARDAEVPEDVEEIDDREEKKLKGAMKWLAIGAASLKESVSRVISDDDDEEDTEETSETAKDIPEEIEYVPEEEEESPQEIEDVPEEEEESPQEIEDVPEEGEDYLKEIEDFPEEVEEPTEETEEYPEETEEHPEETEEHPEETEEHPEETEEYPDEPEVLPEETEEVSEGSVFEVEEDGQFSLMGLLQQSQTQVPGQMEIADVLAQWANTEKEPEDSDPPEETKQTEETLAFDDDVLAGIAAALEGKADTAAEMLSEDTADTSDTAEDAGETPAEPKAESLEEEESEKPEPEDPAREEEAPTEEPEDPKGTFTFDEDVLAGIAAALEGKADTAAEQAASEGIAPEEEAAEAPVTPEEEAAEAPVIPEEEPSEEQTISEEEPEEKPANSEEEPVISEEKTEEKPEEKPKDIPHGKPARPFSATQTLGGLSMEEKFDLEAQGRVGLKAGLTEEQKKAFSYFVPVRGMSEQIVAALSEAEKTPDDGLSEIGNILVAGPKGCGKTMLALNLIKQIRKLQNESKGKAAIIHAESLNKKDVPTTIRKVHGGAIIIEDAGDLERHTVHALDMAMSTDTNNMIVVLEDSKKKLAELLRRHDVFARKFNIRMQIPDFINDELVTFGQAYAKEHGYKIDDMGILALYSRIDVMQKEDHSVTVAEVKDIMDAAFVRSKKNSMRKTMTNFFKSKDENELTTLEEADFAR